MIRWAAAVLVAATMPLVVGGCGMSADSSATETSLLPQKSAASAIRYDTEPLEQKFPKLPRPITGEWVQGILGDEPVAGPNTTFWLDAIIEMPAQQLAAFVQPYRSSASLAVRPTLWKTLNPGVPPAPFERSDDLDRMLSTNTAQGGWTVKAYVPKDDGSVLILSAQGKDAG